MVRIKDMPLALKLFMKTYPWRNVGEITSAHRTKPLSDCTVAIVSSAGMVTPGDKPFAQKIKGGDWSWRTVLPNCDVQTLEDHHNSDSFDHSGIAADGNMGFPLDRLHELANDITRKTKACFEPSIDYVVVKVPRFAFEKFPEADSRLSTQMKSVGETMAIGRTFKEAFQKALRGLEVGSFGFGCDGKDLWGTPAQPSIDDIRARVARPDPDRVWFLRYAMLAGLTIEELHTLTGIDRWFLDQLLQIVELEQRVRDVGSLNDIDDTTLRQAKQAGFSDRQLATLLGEVELDVRENRKSRRKNRSEGPSLCHPRRLGPPTPKAISPPGAQA